MSQLENKIAVEIAEVIKQLFEQEIALENLQIQKTRKDFEGDLTLVVFPLLRISRKSPEQTAELIGNQMKEKSELIANFNVVKGFLNLVIEPSYWLHFLEEIKGNKKFGFKAANSAGRVMVEYSSPNTNKPLHLGHLRNNFLGNSVSRILAANGKEVVKTQIINDRGIHICKSMLAWLEMGEGETPDSADLKGDHLVGKYYVAFDKRYKKEIAQLIGEKKADYSSIKEIDDLPSLKKDLIEKENDKKISEEEKVQLKDLKEVFTFAEKNAPSILRAQEMLRKWEAEDPETRALWTKMNAWVYDGFEKTYQTMGVDFDKLYYESDTFLIGRDKVLQHEDTESFYRKEDSSIWVNLEKDGLDSKLLLRSDGTSVYMTQDIGTAIIREEEFHCENYYYVVGNEQDYHFKVLALTLQKMGFDWANGIEHLSYGMVDLPSGKMKSREGTVVDADDLMLEMKNTAAEISEELGKLDGMSAEEKEKLFWTIGLGALKYFILKVDPKKRMLFDPKESVDFNGNTGPFIQYAHARICSILRKTAKVEQEEGISIEQIQNEDLTVIKQLFDFPEIIEEAAEQKSPALIANYIYDLVKVFNHFYQNTPPIIKEENTAIRNFRLELCEKTAEVINNAMHLLGIAVPEKM